MFKEKLKLIFNYLPSRLKMIVFAIYKALAVRNIYDSPDHFPLNYIKKLDLPIFGTSSKNGYFYRLYQEKRVSYNFLLENLFNYKYEIIYGEHINHFRTYEHLNEDVLVPLCIETLGSELVVINNHTKEEDRLKNLPNQRFHYFKIKQGESYKFTSDSKKGIVVGKPIPLKQKVQHRKKLVLCIFIDGLADFSQIDSFTEDSLMPNTMKFFNKGVRFKNNYSNAEWTLPSVPSFFSGGRQQYHGFYDPKANHVIGDDYKILSEIFQENEYLTFQVNGNWRVSPAYGYVKGFDRTIYKKEMSINESIHSFFEHMRTFNERDNFVWLTLMDIHHLINIIPDISSQKNLSASAHLVTPWHDKDNNTKSVFVNKSKDLTEIYGNEIQRVDYYLKAIYDYIEDNYKNEEFIVSLVSDHGHSFLTNDQNPISIARTKVPWMIRGGEIPQKESSELTENIDFFSGLLKSSDLEAKGYNNESNCPSVLGGEEDREYVISQSIYPGQTYKAILRDKYFEYEFESNQSVGSDGKINGDIAFKKNLPLNKLKGDFDKLKAIEKYTKIIKSKVNEWNMRKIRSLND